MFGQLTKRIPTSDGGLYAYARHEFGDFAGYLTAWCYWITAWAGNAAIVSSWVLYVESLFSITHPSAWTNFGIAMCGLWIPAAVNLVGHSPDGHVPERDRRLEVPAARGGRHRRLVLRPRGELRSVQRDGRELVQRHRNRCGRCALLVHRRRGGLDHRRSRQGPEKERRPRVGSRDGSLRPPVPPRDRIGDGPRRPPQPGRQRRPVRERVPDDVQELLLGRQARRRSRRRSPASAP